MCDYANNFQLAADDALSKLIAILITRLESNFFENCLPALTIQCQHIIPSHVLSCFSNKHRQVDQKFVWHPCQ